MATLQDLINLAKADGGKFFVIDETGEPKMVIMSIDDYQDLLLGKLEKQVEDVESINKEILHAQLTEEEMEAKKPFRGPQVSHKRAFPPVDLREEVIDPSFDFEGPKIEIDDL